MDKHILVAQLERVLASLRDKNIAVQGYRVSPEYVGFRPYPVLVGVVVPELAKMNSTDRISLLNAPLYDSMKPEDRNLISGLLGYASTEQMNDFFDEREGVGRPVVEPYWPD